MIDLHWSSSAHAIMRAAYNGQRNIMTPEVLVVGTAGPYAVEVSKGTGIKQEPIYGVTVVNRHTGEPDRELSRCLFSEEQVNEFLRTLRSIKEKGHTA